MTTIEQEGTQRRLLRERRKSFLYGMMCLAMGATSFAMIKLWVDLGRRGETMPLPAYLALIGVGTVYVLIGFRCLYGAWQGSDRTAGDRTFAADIFWLASLFLFVTLTAAGMATDPHGAGIPSVVGIALMLVGAVYKILDGVKQAELRIRETMLEQMLTEHE